MIIIFFNILILSLYIFNFDLPQTSSLKSILYLLFFLSVISIFFKSKNIFKKIINMHLSLASIVMVLLVLELTYFLKPSIIPYELSTWVVKEKNVKVTEILDESPYVKFKPKTKIKISSYRGTPDQFSYEWVTDKNGFKNNKEIENHKNLKIIALGDSFVEGMGVDVNETFPSMLSQKGYPTYNFGVQGYSLAQSLGVLKKYGLNYKPEIIILGYVKGTYFREHYFIENEKKRNLTNGKVNYHELDDFADLKPQGRYITSAIWISLTRIKISIRNLFFRAEFTVPFFNKFSSIKDANIEEKIAHDTWTLLIKNLSKIKKIADQASTKIIFVYFDRRPRVYYEKATNKKLPKNVYYERDALKKFSKSNNITFLDMGDIMQKYVNKLPNNFEYSDLPYLELDGHLSKMGNKIVSNEIIKIIND